ncbi:hypothetical protein [Plantactinospora sp. CA-290183]|uniref:hypothetical protein n=1 Tax=Plantactinospora sp. CA-290183 TaxID=3240006 RepID=UPI003D8DD3C7
MPSGVTPRPARQLAGILLLAAPALLAGCGAEAVPTPPPTTGPPAASQPTQARQQLAALAAAAQDRQLAAVYTLRADGQPDRTVAVTRARNGSWRVDIPGGVLGGTGDVSVVQSSAGLYQCSLPSVQRPEAPGCVRVSDPGKPLDPAYDPALQHPFTDWPEVLTDRQAPLSVTTTQLAGARGSCFAVESTSASVDPPLDPGIYCYDPDGTLTAARLPAGTLVLAGTPAAAPETVTLPGPLVDREPLGVAAPPDDLHSPVPDGSGSPTG